MTELSRIVHEAIGHASMCWKETPTGEFDSTEAANVAEKLIKDIKEATIGTSPGPYGLLHMGRGSFGEAIRAAKAGLKVARSGWNGAGMYAVIMPGYPDGIPCNEATAKTHNVDVGTVLKFRPYWQLKTAQNDIAMWAPSGSDSLADDWCIIN